MSEFPKNSAFEQMKLFEMPEAPEVPEPPKDEITIDRKEARRLARDLDALRDDVLDQGWDANAIDRVIEALDG